MLKVLIADDELRLRKVVSLHLKKAGFEVFEAGNGRIAMDLARAVNPDIIVLDVMMPEMDGVEACKHIRKDPALRDVPVILLTARAADADIALGKDAGASEYITKPFSPKELIRVINESCSGKISRQDQD